MSPSQVNVAARPLMSSEQASRIVDLEDKDFDVIIKLASLGLKAPAIAKYANEIVNDRLPPPIDVSGAPKAVTIVAWSFVKDRGQYGGTYGLTTPEAGELEDLLLTDRDAGLAKIAAIVTTKLRRSGSQKPVTVSPDGIPSTSSKGKHSPPANDGGLRYLAAEIRSNSGVYGSYHFDVEHTGKVGMLAYRVKLGGGLYAYGQSKKLAVAVARVARVRGRSDDLVVSNVGLVIGDSVPKFGTDISQKISFDARLGPNDDLPPDAVAKAKTEAPPA